jgi:hypothetical protein
MSRSSPQSEKTSLASLEWALAHIKRFLPSDERKHWLRLVHAAGDPLDRAVADFAMSGT